MGNITESPIWEDNVLQIEAGDSIGGGPQAVANLQAQDLANRTKYLKAKADAADGNIDSLFQDTNRLYDGVNLETKFAAEIAEYSDVWAWIKARITAVDYSGLHIGDYVQFTIGTNTVRAQIAGIDTYREYGDVAIGHHIDFISKDCYPTAVKWNSKWYMAEDNNGISTNAAPWMVCQLKNFINGILYNSLPPALKAQIIEKRLHIETRYSSGSTLIDSTSWAWNDIGKLWVPSEFEVYGGIVWGTKGYSQNGSVQYPIFANSWKSRQKGAGHYGSRSNWWLLSVFGGNADDVCVVDRSGFASYAWVSYDPPIYAPVCFRIG